MEHELYKENVAKELRTLHDFKTSLEAKASQVSIIVFGAISVLSLLVGIVALFYKK